MTNNHTIDRVINSLKNSDPGFAKATHALTRMTITPSIFQAGEKSNIIPDSAKLTLDIRTLPGQDWHSVENYFSTLLPKNIQDRITLIPKLTKAGSSDPWDDSFISTMKEVVSTMLPDTPLIPTILPGSRNPNQGLL